MRMRKLGRGQSVVFFVPPEVRQKMTRNHRGYHHAGSSSNSSSSSGGGGVMVADILRWSITETLDDCSRLAALWATQGARFQRQEAIWEELADAGGVKADIEKEHASRFLEEESRDLKRRYGPMPCGSGKGVLGQQSGGRLPPRQQEQLEEIGRRCEELGLENISRASAQEEQQRELSVELQAEQLTAKVQNLPPQKPSLHADVKAFVTTGLISPTSAAFLPAFMALRRTSAADAIDLGQFSRELLVTEDFARTVQLPEDATLKADNYQRPVQWIVTKYRENAYHSSTLEHMVIFSPWEVGQLLDDFRGCRAVNLHLYAPRVSLSYLPLDDLRLYTINWFNQRHDIPRPRAMLLNLFAGALYLRSYSQYLDLCCFLGVQCKETPTAGEREEGASRSTTFRQDPLPFFRELIKIRWDRRDVSKTDLGRVLAGLQLSEKTFEERYAVEDENEDWDGGSDGSSSMC